MAIPNYQSIMLPLLELAGDNKIHRVRDAEPSRPAVQSNGRREAGKSFPVAGYRNSTTT